MDRRLGVGAVLSALFGCVIGVLLYKGPGQDITGYATGGGAVTAPPNILLVIADDIGVDKIGAYAADASADYGAEAIYLPETPVIDGLASAGVRFTDAWANPSCSPTRAAIYTGNHSFRTGVGKPVGQEGSQPLDSASTTIAEALAEVGYRSGMFGKWHLGENGHPEACSLEDGWADHFGEAFAGHELNPMTHGWQAFAGTIRGGLTDYGDEYGYTDWLRLDGRRCEGCEGSDEDEVEVIHETTYATSATVQAALAWIASQGERPWMATVTLHAAHEPIELPPEGCSYRPEGAEAPVHGPAVHSEMIECMDIELGNLLAGIEDLDDTLVVFVGDNGSDSRFAELDFDDGRGKGTLYESGVRVPLIIADGKDIARTFEDFAVTSDWLRSPDVVLDSGREIADFAHVVDLFRTFTDVAGAAGATGEDSISLVPLLADLDGEVREVNFAETFGADGVGKVAIRKGWWKLIVNVRDDDGDGVPCRGSYELYNLNSDRFESTSILRARPETAEQMKSALDAVSATAASPWFEVDDC